jgi:fatty acid desaturase
LEVNEMSLQAEDRKTEDRKATTTATPGRTHPPDPAYDKARERAKALQGLYVHLFVFSVVTGALFLINWATRGPNGGWWFYWPLLGWGVAVVIHLATVFLPVFSPDWVDGRAARIAARRDGRA